eukprot:1484303-Alexandrium_andersonii.AAC.1
MACCASVNNTPQTRAASKPRERPDLPLPGPSDDIRLGRDWPPSPAGIANRTARTETPEAARG